MGTRARVNVIDGDDGETLVSIYRQLDGYPKGLGRKLAEFAGPFTIVNGITGSEPKPAANGLGCFAAQLIAHLKNDIGDVYIRDTSDTSYGEEFCYDLSENSGRIWMSVRKGRMTMFGNPGDPVEQMARIWEGYASDFSTTFINQETGQ